MCSLTSIDTMFSSNFVLASRSALKPFERLCANPVHEGAPLDMAIHDGEPCAALQVENCLQVFLMWWVDLSTYFG